MNTIGVIFLSDPAASARWALECGLCLPRSSILGMISRGECARADKFVFIAQRVLWVSFYDSILSPMPSRLANAAFSVISRTGRLGVHQSLNLRSGWEGFIPPSDRLSIICPVKIVLMPCLLEKDFWAHSRLGDVSDPSSCSTFRFFFFLLFLTALRCDRLT